MQGVDPSGRGYLRAASTPKHYAGYNFDSWHGMDRYHYNALISKQDWADTYSQPFQASVVGVSELFPYCHNATVSKIDH